MGHLEILKKLDKRKRRAVELNKSMVSSIQYQADVKRQIDTENARAEHTRIRGHLLKMGSWHPQVTKDRYDELSRYLSYR